MSTPAEKFTSRDTDPDISAIDSIFQAQQRTALEWRRSTAAERISQSAVSQNLRRSGAAALVAADRALTEGSS